MNGDSFAFPAFDKYNTVSENGLNNREYIAAMAMQALITSNPQIEYGDNGRTRPMAYHEIAAEAVNYAEFLLQKLHN